MIPNGNITGAPANSGATPPYSNITNVPAESLLGNSTAATANAQAITPGSENGFIGTTFASIMDFADFTTLTAGADATTALQNFRVAGFIQAVFRGALQKSNVGNRVRIKQRCMAGYPLTTTCPDVIPPFVDSDFPLQNLRKFPSGGTATSFYNGDTTSKAFTNLQMPTTWISVNGHFNEIQINGNPDSVNIGAGIIGPRYWQLLSGGTGAIVGSQGAGGYLNGETVTVVIGGLAAPFVAPTFTLTVVAGSITALTPVNLGVLPMPPKMLRKAFGDPITAWTNPVTGGPTWADCVTATATTAATTVFDASGYYKTTGGSGSGLTINIPDDTTAWNPDFSGALYTGLFQSVQCSTVIGNIKTAGIATTINGTYGPSMGCMLSNKYHFITGMDITGGYYGLYCNAVDVTIDAAHINDSFISFKQASGGNVTCPQLILDSPLDHYMELDSCVGMNLKGRCFTSQSLDLTGSASIIIGANSSSSTQNRNHDLDFELDAAGTSTGIPALSVAYIQASTINLKISNIESKTGAATSKKNSLYASFGSGIANNNSFLGRVDGMFSQIYSGTLPKCYFNIWDAEAPLQYGSITATIGGSSTNNDTIQITFTNVGIFGLPVTVTTTVTGGQTTTQIATQMAADCNANSTLSGVNISATSTGAVVTYYNSGSQANSTVITKAVTGSATETVTLSNGGAISGSQAGGTFKTGGIYELIGSGAPTSGTAHSTGLNKAIAGSTYFDTSTQSLYVNENTAANPAWVFNNAASNPSIAVNFATTTASDTSGLTYSNGVLGVAATFTGSVNTALTFDGQTVTSLNQRVLVKNDTQAPSGAFNGVYYLTQLQTALLAPILTRALDYDTVSDMNGTGPIAVISGATNANTSWLLTSTVTTIGTDALTYTQFTYAPSTTQSGVFASKPGSPVVGQHYFATDLGTGIDIVYDGSKWKPASGVGVIFQSGTATTTTNSISESNIRTMTIPAGLVSANGSIRLSGTAVATGAVNNKNMLVRFAAGQNATSGGTLIVNASMSLSQSSAAFIRTLYNANSVSAQVCVNSGNLGAAQSTNAITSPAINTAVVSYINFNGSTTATGGSDTIGYVGLTGEWLEP